MSASKMSLKEFKRLREDAYRLNGLSETANVKPIIIHVSMKKKGA